MNVVIATTGTGGDLFPGIAVAQSLQRTKGVKILFVVSGIGPEEEVLRRYGFSFERINVGRLTGQNLMTKIGTVLGLPFVLLSARSILKRFGASVVFGGGGYSAGPVVLAAWMLGVPRVVFEPNCVPGLTNRLLGRVANKIFVGFSGMEKYFSKTKVIWTGTPTRETLKGDVERRSNRFSVLILGGSQGAASLNRALLNIYPTLRGSEHNIHIHHQTGKRDFENVKKQYESLGASPNDVIVEPFIQDMKTAYGKADLVICRAGGGTVAELIFMGRPALLVPYPHSVNDHQQLNAQWLVKQNSAALFSDQEVLQNPKTLLEKILHLASSRQELEKMTSVMATLPGRDAASIISKEMMEFINV